HLLGIRLADVDIGPPLPGGRGNFEAVGSADADLTAAHWPPPAGRGATPGAPGAGALGSGSSTVDAEADGAGAAAVVRWDARRRAGARAVAADREASRASSRVACSWRTSSWAASAAASSAMAAPTVSSARRAATDTLHGKAGGVTSAREVAHRG